MRRWIHNDTECRFSNEYADEGYEIEVVNASCHDAMVSALIDALEECITDVNACCFHLTTATEIGEALERRLNYITEVALAAIAKAEGQQ